ncbi:hypothetical protein SK066_04310 [Paenibacillus hunanensis]|uniref:hypothetical protein n=1 Tax=Paenibacillus hunanensis TaxID=539262 RepID=UPI002A69913E|nr:hypothetical protein [Paenibacillus hunanensis]WPP42187.1 hypothetical protein SK066_04310 [Paenibacillus hunanensis]
MNKFLKGSLVFSLALVMYIVFSPSTIFAATVGQSLPKAETGWTSYTAKKLPLLRYDDSWNFLDSDEKAGIPFAGTLTSAKGNGSLKFNFKGTGLRLITAVNYSYSKKVAVSIDGNVEYFSPGDDAVKDYKYNILKYEKTGLASEVHEVEIWTVEKSTVTLGNDYRLYRVDIQGELTADERVEQPPVEQPPVTEEPPAAEQPSSDRAILVVTMTTGLEKEFDLSMTEVNSFINWYEAKQAGTGKASYAIDKHDNNKGPFKSRKDYVLFDRILTFEVSEY